MTAKRTTQATTKRAATVASGHAPTQATILSPALATLAAAILLAAAPATAQAQWEIEASPTTASLRGIDSLPNGVAWASGSEGTVLRTLDGGKTWQPCAVPLAGTKDSAEKLDFRGIQAFDANTAIVMSSGPGDQSRLYKTTNGCQSWTLLFTNPDKTGFFDDIKFRTRDEGVLLGDPVNNIFVVLLTFDGGGKWERQTLRATEDINGEGVFAASNSSLLLSTGGRFFVTGGPGGPRIVSLGSGPTDVYAGDVKKTKKLPWETDISAERLPESIHLDSSGAFSIAEDHQGLGTMVAVGGNYTQPNDRQDTAWTNVYDPSQPNASLFPFHAAKTPPHGYRSAVAYDAPTKTWITVGPNGTDISTDDGRNWRALTPNHDNAPDADRNWNALSLPFVVGPKGRIGKLRPNALPPPTK